MNLRPTTKESSPSASKFPNASKQPFWIRFNDGETTLLNDLYSGEVWLCGGQSNMEMPVQGWGCVLNYEQEVANAAYPFIRLLQVSNTLAFSPQEDAAVNNGGWQVCSPATVANFSALAYFFGRELYKKLNVPIGLVYSAWGGTPCESWVSFETAKAVGGFESTLNMYEECNFDRDAILARDPGAEHFQKPTLEYNAMIHPLRIMPIAGAIWYQGENNVGNNVQYEPLSSKASSTTGARYGATTSHSTSCSWPATSNPSRCSQARSGRLCAGRSKRRWNSTTPAWQQPWTWARPTTSTPRTNRRWRAASPCSR